MKKILYKIDYIIHPAQINAEVIVVNTEYIKQAITETEKLVFTEQPTSV